MYLDPTIKKTTIASTVVLVLFLTSSVPAVVAATGSGAQASSHVMKANLVRTVNLDPNTVATTSPSASSSNDVPANAVGGAEGIPGKANALTDSNQGTSASKAQGSLTTPAVQGLDVSGSAEGANTVKGLNAFDLWSTHLHFNVEPPDQMLCASNDFVFEGVNDNVRVYTSDLKPASTVQTIEGFFGLPIPGALFALSDPKCYFDSPTGRWFVTVTVPFDPTISFVLLAVSTSKSPLGAWNVYAIDTTDNGTDGTPNNPGCVCLGDQPLLGANPDAIFISTNEFSSATFAFNGANMYVLDKAALAQGSPSVNVVLFTLGLSLSTPDGPCLPADITCWYTVQPATSPGSLDSNNQNGNQADNGQGGVEYALSALQFGDHPYELIDNRIAVWAFTNTQSITSDFQSIGVQFRVIGSESYETPITFAAQKAGPTPRGDFCKFGDPAKKNLHPCSDANTPNNPAVVLPGPIQPNDDRMNQVVFANGLLWGGLNTAVKVTNEEGAPSIHNGIAYFVVQPGWHHGILQGSIWNQGYIAATGADVLFPSVGVTDSGQGVIAFTLTGHDFYPSAAFVTIDGRSTGDQVNVAAKGQSPSDGFTEFQFFGTSAFRPRWGDYSAAVAFGGKVYFSTEYIQYPSCSDSAWAQDPSCGGTRGRSANWGTSISVITT
jgi:hypothetical protein